MLYRNRLTIGSYVLSDLLQFAMLLPSAVLSASSGVTSHEVDRFGARPVDTENLLYG